MDYYNKTLEIIIKNQKATNQNLITLNNNQKYQTNLIFKNIEINRSLIYDLEKEIKLIREDLKQIKSVFNLDKESNKDEVISSPPKEYQEMIDLLNKVPNYKNGLSIRNHNCLSSANIKTNYDLVKCSKRDLMKIRNFGKHSYDEVIEYLNWNNLTIGMDISEYEPYLKQNESI